MYELPPPATQENLDAISALVGGPTRLRLGPLKEVRRDWRLRIARFTAAARRRGDLPPAPRKESVCHTKL